MDEGRGVHIGRLGALPHSIVRHITPNYTSRTSPLALLSLRHEGHSTGDYLVEPAYTNRLFGVYRAASPPNKIGAKRRVCPNFSVLEHTLLQEAAQVLLAKYRLRDIDNIVAHTFKLGDNIEVIDAALVGSALLLDD